MPSKHAANHVTTAAVTTAIAIATAACTHPVPGPEAQRHKSEEQHGRQQARKQENGDSTHHFFCVLCKISKKILKFHAEDTRMSCCLHVNFLQKFSTF